MYGDCGYRVVDLLKGAIIIALIAILIGVGGVLKCGE